MRKEKRGIRSTAAVAALLAASVFAVWIACMFCFTSVAAEAAGEQALTYFSGQADWIAATCLTENRLNLENQPKNHRERLFWEAVSEGVVSKGVLYVEGGRFLEWKRPGEIYAATAIYDAEGNCIEKSWDDFFFFEYMSEAQWAAGADRQYDSARAFFDRDRLTEAGRLLLERDSLRFDAAAMRFTGVFDGVELTPVRIDYIDDGAFRDALAARGDGSYTVSGIVNSSDLQWITIYEAPDAVPAGAETVTLYSGWADACFAPDSPSFSYQGRTYDGVESLLAEVGPALAAGWNSDLTRYEGLDLLIFDVSYRETYGGEAYDLSQHYGEEAYEDGAPELQFYVASAVYCSPWRAAMAGYFHVYLLTFLLAAALVLGACALIRRQLVRPLRLVGEALSEGRDRLELRPRETWSWREGRLVAEGFRKENDHRRKQSNELARLTAALDYAKAAEENRRQMTSGIAHELKTPLAVIHSYAEGLKERIAEEKREKYLDVILSEAERTDAMVLELLDLSRLEAGKVTLSRDEFSLTAMARDVFERLEMAARAKELRVEFDCPGDCVVAADEGRIAQVVENFAANAVKYTPAGGRVLVRLRAGRFGTTLSVENDSEPLSEEALERVWDTFYRTDEARSGGGTGLGLAISKNIIELHGGKCAVRNTESGVEFRFTLL